MLFTTAFRQDWRGPYSYDIVLNTSRVPTEACVRQIRLLADCPAYEETDASRAALAGKLIEARVQTIVDGEWSNTPYGGGITVSVENGSVKLQGVTSDTGDIETVLEKIRTIDGVKDIKNDVLVARQAYGV